ncbi:MAG: hypothetical protein A3J28_13905 [Acidobacteria bacterium RIFCSPLOWO2_12_FULL_60_22]|nr:MAG: hypothetical protein A3J28_13905 [Acidobacteria bacterium RIFCSPLOWO2_12_FULL_60_22]
MSRRILSCLGMFLLGIGSIQAAKPQQPSSAPASAAPQHRATLNRYCVTCHNDRLKTSGLTLEKIDVENVPAGAEVWEKVIRKLRARAMPLAGAPRPDEATYESLASYLETSIDRVALAKPNPGTPTVHRLNRAEYVNAIRDLLSVEVDAESLLPVDDSGYGFDNNGDVLSVSPVLLERYMSAARKVSRLAVGDSSVRPTMETYEVSENLRQDDRMSEDLPLGSRGGISVRHNFQADGEYVIKVRLKRDGYKEGGPIRGVALNRQLLVLLDDEEIKLFTVGGERFGRSVGDGGAACVTGALVSCQGDPAQEEYERFGADKHLEVRFAAKAGQHLIKAAFLVADASKPEGAFRRGSNVPRRGGKMAEPAVESLVIRGPYEAKGLGETPSRRKIFVCHPGGEQGGSPIKVVSLQNRTGQPNTEVACAKRILSALVRRAYRRPATEEDLQELMSFYNAGRSKGGFEVGIRTALERILVGPQFLFRIEWDPANLPPGAAYRLSDRELASRLSFFLWSSLPDDELLNLAERGKLRDREVLKQQVQRMLRDPRSKELVRNFTGQWLQLRRVQNLSPDIVEFPDFDENLREAFQQETELFLESMLREDRPLMEMLGADYTFLNERLARHYGIPNIYGSSFRRVKLTDENRRGLLGQGSILSLTSYPTRTSVVLRGVWLLTNIMGTPPPAPPPNVPPLKDRNEDGRIKSVRESMEQHRANPVCATCHSRMDPLGFAFENFDAVGAWRTTEGAANTIIDSSGKLPDGTSFRGPAELRKVLLSKSDQFATVVAEKLLTYALGRGVEYHDQPFVRKIRGESAPDYRWSSLILAVVESQPFQMRRVRQP